MDIKKIKAIIALVKESGIAELEIVEGEEKLKITLNNLNVITTPSTSTHQIHLPQHKTDHPIPSITPEIITKNDDRLANSRETTINSPMVGTFYRASSPTSQPFVEVEQTVKAGQILCIIEAMKLMNQIETETSGIIKEILVKDGEPVEYGQPLFIIDQL